MHQVAISEHLVKDKMTLEEAGFVLYVPESIGEVAALMTATGRSQQSAMLSLDNNDFTSASGVFHFLFKEGYPVAGARAKLVDLQDESFEDHQRRAVRQWYNTDEDRIKSIARPLNKLITGKHIYAGELEFHPDFRGKRAITTAFVRTLIASAFLKWPDVTCVYCILPDRHRHLAADYGFGTMVRNAYSWHDPIPGGRLPDWGVAVSSRDQLTHDLTAGYWGPAPREPE